MVAVVAAAQGAGRIEMSGLEEVRAGVREDSAQLSSLQASHC